MEACFMLFEGDTYYPCGGMEDLRGVYYTLADAQAARQSGSDWYHIVRVTTEPLEFTVVEPTDWTHSLTETNTWST